MTETATVPQCSRYALLLGPDGRKRKLPVLDVTELQETYEFHGDVYTVVSVFTSSDDVPVVPPVKPARVEGRSAHNTEVHTA